MVSFRHFLMLSLSLAFCLSQFQGEALDFDDFSQDADRVTVSLYNVPEASFEILEYSEDLSFWTPIARDYGNGWESIFPMASPIHYDMEAMYTFDPSLAEDFVMLRPRLSRYDFPFIELPLSEQGYFRKRTVADIEPLSNEARIAQFLMQCTFGPRIEDIEGFPGVDTESLELSHFESWIDGQIAMPPFSHRAFFRERANYKFIKKSPQDRLPFHTTNYWVHYLENEVAFNSELGHQLDYYEGPVHYPAHWACPLPGHGGLFDENNNPIDASDYPEDQLDWRGIPMIGSHVQDAYAYGNSQWDLLYPWTHTKEIIWYEAVINGTDQLRQRMAWALSQFFVVGEIGSDHSQLGERWTNYYDIFVRNAFGNFRDILSEVTWSPHMGYYLSHLNNKKANAEDGTFPDENFAREVMQLFTIGLWELNQDGTYVRDETGGLVATYNNDDIAEFAKVFTGLRLAKDRENIEIFYGNYVDPMRVQYTWHDFSQKTLLDGSKLGPFPGTTQGVIDEIEGLLDHLFNHPNVPPFFARFLIQRFTVSNPSPSYIESVAQAFKKDYTRGVGSGIRGDLTATIKAILLHPEARSHAVSFDANHGKLREPLIKVMHLARAINLTSKRVYGGLVFSNLQDLILQAPYHYPSVFNFYRPDYSPNGEIADQFLTSPEFQIHNDVTALQLSNAVYELIHTGLIGGPNGITGHNWHVDAEPNYSLESRIMRTPGRIFDHINLILTGGKIGPSMRVKILDAVADKGLSHSIEQLKYIFYLVSLTPEFNTIY